jgi:hypothetical protein
MEEKFYMKSVCYDSVLLTDKTEYNFFVDNDDRYGDRVGSILESNIVNWFFNHPLNFAPHLFYEELDIDQRYILHLNVGKPIITDNRVPGDIDILLVDPNKPQRAIAIQVKRVKATINEGDEASLNVKKVPYSIFQTKEMFTKYQFYKSYLMLVILVDAQHRTGSQQMFRHLAYPEKKTVYFHSGFADLPEEAGIYVLEIDQPSLNSVDLTSRISAKALKMAKPVEQLSETTENIIQLLKRKT